MTYVMTPEQVAVAWLKTVDGIDSTKVATSLPGDPAVWGATGFVTVAVVGGTPGDHVPLYRPVVSVTAWATTPGSAKPPWGRAGSMAGAIVWATYRFRGMPVDLGADFAVASLLSVRPLGEPRRIPDETPGFARVAVDLELSWTTNGGPAA